MESKKQIYRVSFTIDEIRPLVLRYLDTAQNIANSDCLMKCTTYSIWHDPLIEFFKKNKNEKKPSKSDKLAFVILLSYPRRIIEGLTYISELSLFGNSDNETDFTYNAELTMDTFENNYGENNSGTYDCICSQYNLRYVHFVENKHSGIRLSVGSECINTHKLLSEEEYKKLLNNDKKLQERDKEIKEGKPIGYYKEQKRLKKEEKEKEKIKKQEEREKIKTEKENEKLLRNGNFKRCQMCNTNVIPISLNFCYNCVLPNIQEIKKMEYNIIRDYGLMECQNCDKKCIDKKTECYLCEMCVTTDKIMKCQTLNCQTLMVVDIKTLSVYCDCCEENIIKCIECNKKFISHNNNKKCSCCMFNELNACINIECVRCKNEFTSKKIDNWKRYCKECYKIIDNIILDSPKCKCDLFMVKRNVKKEGVNKGRIGLACDNYPKGCSKFIMF